MSDDGWWIEIVFLAMLAGFIALRLFSVLGRRVEHDDPASSPVAVDAAPGGARLVPPSAPKPSKVPEIDASLVPDPAVRQGLVAIIQADPAFDVADFIEGARQAYNCILQAFWSGKIEDFEGLVSDEIDLEFRRAIEARQAQGLILDNRILSLDGAYICAAHLSGAMVEISVRLSAQLSSVTRNKAGDIVEGAPDAVVPTHDICTFSRHLRSSDPNWLLIATEVDSPADEHKAPPAESAGHASVET